ncbi:hypothetical protein [Candidatus Poriferisodalis sp.]|uniref:hypothetical protein n=1 Tax=Candidatus Poriferisodalis sp. TaxID=3101277 RepID=UPI003B5A11DB
MNPGYLYGAVIIAGLLLLLTYYRLGYGIVRLTRRWLRLLAQVTSTVLGAQIVGLVFFVSTLQQRSGDAASDDYLLNAARNLTYGALISILGLFLMLMFAASVQKRTDRNGWGRTSGTTEKLVMACAVVGIAFTGLVHLALMLPLILLEPLL